MRLINTNTLALEEFFGNNIPPYAILSHTWGSEEVTFQDWKTLAIAREKRGFQKIELARSQAISQGLEYLWVDTNCINKESSTELAEAINSMYTWYRNAEVCYAYLSDVSEADDPDKAASKEALASRLSQSQWFTRGWTLQELLAPRQVLLFSREWRQVGTRKALVDLISEITGISTAYMSYKKKRRLAPISSASVAERMSWLSCRRTSRIEDMAYCMLGIFDISMPLLYGEGSRAFTRLQEEILKVSTDESLFCWSWNENDPPSWPSMLAPYPKNFRNAGGYRPARNETKRPVPYSMTNFGLSIQLPVFRLADMPRDSTWLPVVDYVAVLSASEADGHLVGIPLEGTKSVDTFRVVRDCPRPIVLRWKNSPVPQSDGLHPKTLDIFVPSRDPSWSLNEPYNRTFDDRFSLGEFSIMLLAFPRETRKSIITSIGGIPRYSKSRGNFIKMKKFTIFGPPNSETLLSKERSNVVEVHGAMVRIRGNLIGLGNEPLCLLFGVFVTEEGSTRWFHRRLDEDTRTISQPGTVFAFTHRTLETLLIEEAAHWQAFGEYHKAIEATPASTIDEWLNSNHISVATHLGPEFVVEVNRQKTMARALHLHA